MLGRRSERLAFDVPELLGLTLVTPCIRTNLVYDDVASGRYMTQDIFHARKNMAYIFRFFILGICAFSHLDIKVKGSFFKLVKRSAANELLLRLREFNLYCCELSFFPENASR